MGGDTIERSADTSEIEELGSVGDWRLPDWVQRIPGLAWLFIALAIADVFVELAFRLGPLAALGEFDLGQVAGRVAFALPILIPAAIILRSRQRPPSLADPLLAGSIAVAVAFVLGTVALVLRRAFDPMTIGDATDIVRVVGLAVARAAGICLTLVGTILLGRALMRHRLVHVPGWAKWARVLVVCLTGAEIAWAIWWAVTTSYALYASAFADSGQAWVLDWSLALLGTFTLIGWAYLAWAVLSGGGDQGRPGLARACGLAWVGVRQVEIGLALLSSVWSTLMPPSSDETPLILSLSTVFTILYMADSVLLVVAFASGLGTPRAAEPEDPPPVELEPIPNPG